MNQLPRLVPPALAFAVIVVASFWARAQLGGADGVQIPYAGHLDRDGSPANGSFSLTMRVYTSANAPTECASSTKQVVASAGAFTAVFGPFTEGCFFGTSPHVSIDVQGAGDAAPVPLTGRQRLVPALASHTSGRGDFFVQGALLAAGDTLVVDDNLEALDISAADVVANNLSADHVTAGAGLTVSSSGASITGNSTLNGSLTVSSGSVSVAGTVTWDCPANSQRVGAWCMTADRGSASSATSAGNAIADCASLNMNLCPVDAIVACDQLNVPSGSNQCGGLTDSSVSTIPTNSIVTSTIANGGGDSFHNAFDNHTCYAGGFTIGLQTYSNSVWACGTGYRYFCCLPVSPR